jgi:hypothetical protein
MHTLLILIFKDCLLWIGTELVRFLERSAGMQGICETWEAQVA